MFLPRSHISGVHTYIPLCVCMCVCVTQAVIYHTYLRSSTALLGLLAAAFSDLWRHISLTHAWVVNTELNGVNLRCGRLSQAAEGQAETVCDSGLTMWCQVMLWQGNDD